VLTSEAGKAEPRHVFTRVPKRPLLGLLSDCASSAKRGKFDEASQQTRWEFGKALSDLFRDLDRDQGPHE
jgi:hypothetical protein